MMALNLGISRSTKALDKSALLSEPSTRTKFLNRNWFWKLVRKQSARPKAINFDLPASNIGCLRSQQKNTNFWKFLGILRVKWSSNLLSGSLLNLRDVSALLPPNFKRRKPHCCRIYPHSLPLSNSATFWHWFNGYAADNEVCCVELN